MKRSLQLFLVTTLLLSAVSSQAEENHHANNFGLGIDVNNTGNNYGLGISVLSPWFFQNHVALKLNGGIGLLSGGVYDPMANAGLTLMVGTIAFGGFGRFYGFLNPGIFFDTSTESLIGLWNLAGGFGFEFFLDEEKHGSYYLETGGVGGSASETKILNGFFMRVGYNYRF